MSTHSTFLTPDLNDYLVRYFSAEDDFLRQLNTEAEAEGIPPISIAPEQTAFLQVLIKATNARTIVEVGSLAGYSAIAMARALPPDGTLIACEVSPKHCDFIRRKVHEAGLDGVIQVAEGPALHTLPDMISEQSPDGVPFIDVVFIDADKQNYRRYLDMLYPYVRTGGLIIGDNALAWGHVHEGRPDFEPDNVSALRAFNDVMSSHPGLQSTLVPLGDGMVIGLKTA